jgi:catechol 2,3-dioxygenase
MRAYLHHIALESADPEALAQFYAKVMGSTAVANGDGWSCVGPGRRLLTRSGKPKKIMFAGYAMESAEELDRLRRRLVSTASRFDSGRSSLFEDTAIAISDPDGNRFEFGLPRQESAIHVASPEARLQHLVVASKNIDRLIGFHTQVLGFRLSDRVVDEQGIQRTAFLRSNDEHHTFACFMADENRLDHHSYETADWSRIRDWADRLAAMNIPLQWGPGRHGPGNNLFLFFHDLDGNWVEISAELEIVEPTRPVGTWPHSERTLNTWGVGLLRS